ncbi:hypothetical protein QCA50_005373 [Cerrena zonata]|uniref:F-box domain-containing protein n=1 Tax=Cerrena zonata TaxID=2478898 RepID=A0AAW0GP02_9APHY
MSHAPVETIEGSPELDKSLANVKLLPELLSIIIETYVFDFLHSYCVPGQSPALHPQNSWLRISHVCRYWRDVALATPTIWSHIPLIRLECVEEMLRRSKQAPLTVYVHSTTSLNESSSPMLKSIAKQSHRIRNIDTSLPSEFFTQLTSYAPTTPLDLQSVVASYKRLLGPPSSLPLEWIKNANLKHLSLKDFPVENINLLLMPSLTSLSLWLSKHECVPGDDLLEALQHMHSLRSLTLHNVVQDILTLPPYPNKRDLIRMPRLQSIATTSYTNGLAELSLLSAIDIPPHVDFSFVIHNAVYPETQEVIWSYIMDNLVKDVRLPFHSVFIYAYAGGNFLFTARSPSPAGSTRDSTLFQISLHFPVVSEAEKWLSRLCTSLPCSKVRNLSVGNFISFPVEAWDTSFKSMTHVESLEVTGLACTALPEALLLAAVKDSQISGSKPIFPNLRQLTVWLNPTAKGETVPSRVNGICDALQERKDRGYQLELLILRGHPPLVEEFNRLIPVVGKVAWDR